MPATQPALGLPTMNPLCQSVRAAHRAAQAAQALTPEQLREARAHALTAAYALRMAYRLLTPHTVLSAHCEAAGKTAARLADSVALRLEGKAS
ncbi:MAG: hypothetical protein V4609_13370 [Pseudomonadota bacterium]